MSAPVFSRDGKNHVLHTEQWLPAPLPQVFGFFSDAFQLEALTPPFLHFQVLTPRSYPAEIVRNPPSELSRTLRSVAGPDYLSALPDDASFLTTSAAAVDFSLACWSFEGSCWRSPSICNCQLSCRSRAYSATLDR